MSTWGRSDPKDEEVESSVRLERVGRASRTRLIVAFVGIAFAIGLMWAKPWNSLPPPVAVAPVLTFRVGDESPGPEPSPSIEATAKPRPTPNSDPVAITARRRQCQSPENWRMVTAESTATRDTRTMYAAAPVAANGAADPALPLSHLYAGSLMAVGVCVPRSPVISNMAILNQVVLWQVDDRGTAREIQRPVVVDNDLYDSGEAYFAPPIGEGPFWPEGRYIFEVRRLEGPGSRWFGLEFIPTHG